VREGGVIDVEDRHEHLLFPPMTDQREYAAGALLVLAVER